MNSNAQTKYSKVKRNLECVHFSIFYLVVEAFDVFIQVSIHWINPQLDFVHVSRWSWVKTLPEESSLIHLHRTNSHKTENLCEINTLIYMGQHFHSLPLETLEFVFGEMA